MVWVYPTHTPSTQFSCPRSLLYSGKRQHLQKVIQIDAAAWEMRVGMLVS